MPTHSPSHGEYRGDTERDRRSPGDKCPDCRRGRLTARLPQQSGRLICPRCCHVEH